MSCPGAVRPHDHVLGPTTAKALVVLYADLECPHSKRAHRVVKELAGWYGNLVGIVFRHFPVVQVHPNARRAAEAAEAAHAQGFFWEMADCLFENQQLLDRQHLLRYAARLDLNVQQFDQDLDTGAHQGRVDQSIADAGASGVNVAPTLFVNKMHLETRDFDDVFEAVDLELCSEAPLLVEHNR